jgi:hypothetical protein
MAGLVPATYVFSSMLREDVDGRIRSGHDRIFGDRFAVRIAADASSGMTKEKSQGRD